MASGYEVNSKQLYAHVAKTQNPHAILTKTNLPADSNHVSVNLILFVSVAELSPAVRNLSKPIVGGKNGK